MRLFRRKRVKPETALARLEREAAEKRLAHAQEHVITPLRELRDDNHVGQMIEALIQRRSGRDGTA